MGPEAARRILGQRPKFQRCHAVTDMAAPLASGSFRSLGMIVAPCSIRSMSQLATGATWTLLTRAADVALRERRRHAPLRRDRPPRLGHLRTMGRVAGT